jgi:hypothetical protein
MSRLLAVTAIFLVVTFFIVYIQYPDIMQATANKANQFQQEWVGKTFSQGETLFILERPQFFPELINDVSLRLGFEQFTEDQLPKTYRDLATEQSLAEGQSIENLEVTAIKGDLTKSQVVLQNNTVKPDREKGDGTEAKLVNTGVVASEFTKGEIIPIIGKLSVPNRTAPYFYNLVMYCCGDHENEIVEKSHIATDSNGNFIYKIITTNKFPTGTYDVTISTLSADNRRLIQYTWQFFLSD